MNARTAWASLLLLTAAHLVGCGYSQVSPTTYELAKALFSITNRQATDMLAKAEARIDQAVKAEQISQQEAQWLTEIVELARDGDWASAHAAARRLMEDQIE